MDELDTSVPLCQDCRHSFIPVSQWFFMPFSWVDRLFNNSDSDQWHYLCRKIVKEQRTEFNPVSGSKVLKREYQTCAFARGKYNEECGHSGKMWAPKNKKDIFIYLKRI